MMAFRFVPRCYAFCAIVCAATASSCSDSAAVMSPENPSHGALRFASGPGDVTIERWACYDPTDPHCINEPNPEDPEPTARGVFLGHDINLFDCQTSGVDDRDADQTRDWCEYQVALAFRPMLSISTLDQDASRESYWAARLDYWANRMYIIYLLGYHMDWGNHFDCADPLTDACSGHFGDSEFIEVAASWNATTEHWVFESAFYSAHYGSQDACPPSSQCDFSNRWYPYDVEFPGKPGWYPRSYVARDKHGNYPTRSRCNGGALFGTDDCSENVDSERVLVDYKMNVGSRANPLIDRTTSIAPTNYGGEEWMWTTGVPFCGWDTDSRDSNRGDCAGVYGEYLITFGY